MTIQYLAELAGTYFFAISGVLAADDKDRNWFGATTLRRTMLLAGIVCLQKTTFIAVL